MPMIINGIKYSPAFTVYKGGGEDSGGAYLIKVIDYDGTILKQDHLNTGDTFELPEPPTTHERLTFQTWSSPLQITNNTITVGKSDVTIGAVYTTKSGLNEFVIELNELTGKSFYVRTNRQDVDMGDGNIIPAGSSFTNYEYANYGTYIIRTPEELGFSGGTFQKALIEANISYDSYYNPLLNAFLRGMTFGIVEDSTNSHKGVYQIGQFSLNTLIIPARTTNFAMRGSVVNWTYLENLVIPYGFETFTGSLFSCQYLIKANNSTIEKITFPSTVTAVPDLFERDANGYQAQINIKELNFTEHTFVPTLGNKGQTVSGDLVRNPRFKIRVPKSLESQWKSATNWSAYADYIVGVE